MKPRIMLLEDDLALRDFLAASFMDKGFELMRVSLPHQALSLLDMAAIDLAIIDGGLPEMNGIEVMQEARKRGYRGKFIFISANPEKFLPLQQQQQQLATLGISRIFQKPLHFRALTDHIDDLMRTDLRELQRFVSDDSLTAVQTVPVTALVSSPARESSPSTKEGWYSPEEDLLGYTKGGLLDDLGLLTTEDRTPTPKREVAQPGASPFAEELALLLPLHEEDGIGEVTQVDSREPSLTPLWEGIDEVELHQMVDELELPMTLLPLAPEEVPSTFSVDDIAAIDISTIKVEANKALLPAPSLHIAEPEHSQGLQQRLLQLKQAYGKTLEQRIHALLKLLAPIRRQKSSAALEEAIQISHKLHGTSGTMGHQEISQMSGWIEDVLTGLQKERGELPPQLWEEIYFRVERALLYQQRL